MNFKKVLMLLLVFSFTLIVNGLDISKRPINVYQLKQIPKNLKTFSFAVLGDNRGSKDVFNKIIASINADKDIVFAINNGDLANRPKDELLNFYLNQISKANKPFISVIGNHELKKKKTKKYEDIFGPTEFAFHVGNAYFIIFNDADYKITHEREEWLLDQLEKAKNYKFRFVIMHIPLFDPRYPGMKPGHSIKDPRLAYYLLQIFEEYDVTCLFVSHIHGYFTGKWGKVKYILTGGAGAPLYGKDPKYYFYHYIKVTVYNDKVEYKVVKIK